MACSRFGLVLAASLSACLCLLLPSTAAAGEIDRASAGLRGRDTTKPSKSTRTRSRPRSRKRTQAPTHEATADDADDAEEQDFDREVGRAIMYGLSLPWRVPRALLRSAHPELSGFSDYPYARPGYAHMLTPRDGDRWPKSQSYALRLAADATGSADVVSGSIGGQLDLLAPVAIHGRLRLFGEPSPSEPQPSDARPFDADPPAFVSWAALGALDLLWRFAQSPWLNFHTGLGYLHWADREGPLHGFALYYGFEAHPGGGVTLGSRVGGGPLGQGAAVLWRTHLGVMIGRVEVQLAYDYVGLSGASLGGPAIGLQVHL